MLFKPERFDVFSTGVFSSGMWFTAETCRLIAETETLSSIFVYSSAECLHSDKAAAAATLSTRLLWIMEKAQLFLGCVEYALMLPALIKGEEQ